MNEQSLYRSEMANSHIAVLRRECDKTGHILRFISFEDEAGLGDEVDDY